jgi:hypothetical protein
VCTPDRRALIDFSCPSGESVSPGARKGKISQLWKAITKVEIVDAAAVLLFANAQFRQSGVHRLRKLRLWLALRCGASGAVYLRLHDDSALT